ncbi:MAG: metallophosphoesterase family protein, partial [Candidatus Helarchaeales archaeon]
LEFDRIFFVWGNMDGFSPETSIDQNFQNLHLNPIIMDDFALIGIGGNNSAITKNIDSLEQRLKSIQGKKIILVSHVPPKGHCDLAYNGAHIGSPELLHVIGIYSPILVISGHVHENRTRSKIGQTEIWNVGPDGVLFELDEKIINAKRLS